MKINWKLLLIVLVVVGIYSNILKNGLVWDDVTFIKLWPERRDLIGNFGELWRGNVAPRQEGVYRPVRSMWYGLAYYVFGENPVWYHAGAIAMHALMVLLVYLIVKKLCNERTGLLASFIFGLHPINVEAVAWITASFDSVGVLLAMISIYVFLEWKNNAGKIISLVFALAAYFNNEVTLVLPAIIVLIDWYQEKFDVKKWKKNIWKYLPYFFGAIFFLVVRMIGLGIVARQKYMYDSVLASGLIGVRAMTEFVRSFFIPVKLGPIHVLTGEITSFFYHDFNFEKPFTEPSVWQAEIFISIIFLLGVTVWIYRNWKKERILIVAISWFLLALLPVAQIVPQSIIFAEGEAYLASVGGAMGMAVIIWRVYEKLKPKVLGQGLVILVLAGLILVTNNQTRIWASEETLWIRASQIYDQSTLVNTNLGKYYFENGDQKTGIGYLEKAVGLNDNNVLALTNLGVAYSQMGESQKGIGYLEKANKLSPGYFASEQNLALVYIDVGNSEAARKILMKMVQENPIDTWAYLQIAKSFHKQFIFNQAENYYLKVLELESENLDALNNLGNLYVEWGRNEEARVMYERVLAIDESYGEVKEKMEEVERRL